MLAKKNIFNHQRLGDLLIQYRLINRQQLEKALERQESLRRMRFLEEILVELRALSFEHLKREASKFGKIGEVLLRRKQISPQQLNVALEMQKIASRHRTLGDILLELKFVTEQDLSDVSEEFIEQLVSKAVITENQASLAREQQQGQTHSMPLGEILIESGFLTEDQLVSVIAKHLKLPFLRIERLKIDVDVKDIIPSYVIRRRKVIPLNRMGRLLTIAMVNPFDYDTKTMLEEVLNMKCSPVVCLEKDFETMVLKNYKGPITTTIPIVEDQGPIGKLGPGPGK